jgi:uncharacterized protein (DUF4415 family)
MDVKQTAKSKNARTASIDADDAPELTDEFFEHADEYIGSKLVRRGRPKADVTKVRINLRIDLDVLEVLRATGDGWQARVNTILRERFAL